MFANDVLTDAELREMLAAWVVPDAPRRLRSRIFSKLELPVPAALEKPWYAQSIAASVLIHATALALVLAIFQSPAVRKRVSDATHIYLGNWRPRVSQAQQKAQGGGGGGQKTPLPVNRGAAPRPAAKSFVPPALAVPKPLLPVTPTITAQAPVITADNYGDPSAVSKLISGGPGANGLGSGTGGGIGPGNGNGYGPGFGGGVGGGVYQIGGEVSEPIPIYKPEPEYSEDARKAKYSGTVLLSVVIDEHGLTKDIKVVRPVGLGLDERAIEAVSRWRFRPAMRHGIAVAVQAQIEVSFRLL
jgi:TonB family protein